MNRRGSFADLAASELVRDPARVEDEGHGCGGDAYGGEHLERSTGEGAALGPERPERGGAEPGERRSDQEQEPEPGAVRDTVGPGKPVVDERGPGESPGGYKSPGHDGYEGEERRLHPIATEPQPDGDAEHRRRNADA